MGAKKNINHHWQSNLLGFTGFNRSKCLAGAVLRVAPLTQSQQKFPPFVQVEEQWVKWCYSSRLKNSLENVHGGFT